MTYEVYYNQAYFSDQTFSASTYLGSTYEYDGTYKLKSGFSVHLMTGGSVDKLVVAPGYKYLNVSGKLISNNFSSKAKYDNVYDGYFKIGANTAIITHILITAIPVPIQLLSTEQQEQIPYSCRDHLVS